MIYNPCDTLMFTKSEQEQLKAYVCSHIGWRTSSGCWSPASSCAGWPEWWQRRSLSPTSGAPSLSAGTSSKTCSEINYNAVHQNAWSMAHDQMTAFLVEWSAWRHTPEHSIPRELGAACWGSAGGHIVKFLHRFRIPEKPFETIDIFLQERTKQFII